MDKKNAVDQISGLSVVIPIYNEGSSILRTIEAVQNQLQRLAIPGQIVVVDDGSTDDTLTHLSQTSADVVKHPKNRGYGSALKSGILASKHDWVVITDGDLTYPIEQLPDLLRKIPAFDMVVGAREGKFYLGTPFKTRSSRHFQVSGAIRYRKLDSRHQ